MTIRFWSCGTPFFVWVNNIYFTFSTMHSAAEKTKPITANVLQEFQLLCPICFAVNTNCCLAVMVSFVIGLSNAPKNKPIINPRPPPTPQFTENVYKSIEYPHMSNCHYQLYNKFYYRRAFILVALCKNCFLHSIYRRNNRFDLRFHIINSTNQIRLQSEIY